MRKEYSFSAVAAFKLKIIATIEFCKNLQCAFYRYRKRFAFCIFDWDHIPPMQWVHHKME